MSSPFYLPRKLFSDDKIYPEAALSAMSRYVVVLAEPGGGKTELLNSLACQLGTAAVTANVFAVLGADAKSVPLVIDAFDELAKVDKTGLDKVFAYAKKAEPTHVIISSRSSEWDDAATHRFKQFFGDFPLVVRLCEFDEAEQREIFEHHAPTEDFTQFQAEVARFDLAMLLPNPQFLKLFADAYIESERRFADKRSIFTKAVERLAKEANNTLTRADPPLSTAQKTALASQVFAKLLLSGAEGASISEATESRLYPWLVSLTSGDTADSGILATRLFKPGDHPNLHRPVHKIVAEYCAADYLCKRITDPTNALRLSTCLAIIAPNSTVRDELRGLLGWMAALGNNSIQEALIKLDPYAILANGDPSQLAPSSKRLLLHQLKKAEAQDPYFRRGDFWRRFSANGFFTQDVVTELQSLLSSASEGDLRDLMLELLENAPVIGQLTNELRQLVLASQENEQTRLLANCRLLDATNHDHRADLKALISEGGQTSLELAADIIKALGVATFEHACFAEFFRACAKLYPDEAMHEHTIGARYLIKQFISSLDLAIIEWLLDELTKGLVCQCGKKSYECYCRNGISKIVGSMLDRYFTLAEPPFDPIRVWQWIANLNFHEERAASQSMAVKVLQENADLRQGIIALVLGGLTDHEQIFEAKIHKFDLQSHSGLRLYAEDVRFIVDLAFETDNPTLWASFMARHNYYRNKEEQGPNSLRRHMRKQALEKSPFLQEWAKSNRALAQFARKDCLRRLDSKRKIRRHRKKRNEIRNKNIQYVLEHRQLVESGRHWGCLFHFAELILFGPEKIEQEVGDENIVRNALRNCLDFIAPEVPDLRKFAELHSTSQGLNVERILYAACLEKLRLSDNLEDVDSQLLKALRTMSDVYYLTVSNDERAALKHEVDRLLFSDGKNAEDFLRQYLEPQLAQPGCRNPKIWILQEEVFSHLRATLSVEWLKRFPDLAFQPLETLFDIAARHGERIQLNQIITERCAQLMADYPNPTGDEDIEQKRTFWLLRAWYFLPDVPDAYWNWLKADKEAIFQLSAPFNRFHSSDYQCWPKLSVSKAEAILTAFVDQWPWVDLSNIYGTDNPPGEQAYRFLTEVLQLIESEESDDAIAVLDRLLADSRFGDMHMSMKSMRAVQVRKKSLQHFEPPTPQQIVELLDRNQVVTVEGMRQLVIDELEIYQNEIHGGEFNPGKRFYAKGERLDEEACTEIIAERLSLRLQPQNITITPEHQLKAEKRSDFTVAKIFDGKRRLLVTEVKGQWHKELYTAAAAQLYTRYANHPDAEQQGIYLVIWFGCDEEVAGRKKHGIASAKELKNSIEAKLPPELKGRIDVFVLDVSTLNPG